MIPHKASSSREGSNKQSRASLKPCSSLKPPPPKTQGSEEKDDASTTKSTTSNLLMINPCLDYTRYSYWLKRQFSHQIHNAEIEFIDHVLKIRSRMDLRKYCDYTPMDWRLKLGGFRFSRYIDSIIELIIIWETTNLENGPIPFSKYLNNREILSKDVRVALYSVLNAPFPGDLKTNRNHNPSAPSLGVQAHEEQKKEREKRK